MKTSIVKYFMILPIFATLMMSMSVGTFAAGQKVRANSNDNVSSNDAQVDHIALASQHENLAKEMQAKIQEQIEALNNKPRTSFFGRNGQHIRSHVAYKIRSYEKAVQENMAKAAYHTKIAMEQSQRKAVVESTKIEKKSAPINKTRNQLNNNENAL